MRARLPAAAVLLGAGLLFVVQPMAAKLLLPVLGGAPAVWNTCMVFFQAALLLGYLYAHLLTTYLRPSRQVLVHLAVVACAAATLPPSLPPRPPFGEEWPSAWLLLALARSIGAPFVVLASTAPLIQRWWSLQSEKDPYALYAASNAGSFAALLAFPLLVEPTLDLGAQRLAWTACYVVYGLVVAACALPLRSLDQREPRLTRGAAIPPIAWNRKLRWLGLAAVPTSAMLGVTQYLTLDVAAIPLLWVVPLALYLLTFVVAFSGRRHLSRARWGWILALAVVPAAAGLATYSRLWGFAFPAFHLLTLLATGMLCHGALAADRPHPSRLTEFYLLIAAGGVLGGALSSLVAPLLFDSVAEYPIALAAAVAVRAALARPSLRRRALALALLAPAAVLLAKVGAEAALQSRFLGNPGWVWIAQVGIPAVVCLALAARPLGFALAFLALLWLAGTQASHEGRLLHVNRTFFGVTRVEARDGPPAWHPDLRRLVVVPYHVLYHGSTVHGRQAQMPQLRSEPTSYYHRSGPIGRLFTALGDRESLNSVAIVGLGAGSLTAYGRAGQTMTLYEIDPEVVRTARDPRLFTYLRDSRADLEILLGDGRLRLAEAPEGAYGLLVLDAFSSDAIPVHLLTREALAVYLRALRRDGILALHVTNRHLDLVPVADALAADAGLTGTVFRDRVDDARQRLEGKEPSTWVILARRRETLGPLPATLYARPLPGSPVPAPRYLWTDSFSNLVSVFRLSSTRN